MENVKLFPLDVEKGIVTYTDGAPTVEMVYIFGQFKDPDNEELWVNIVTCDSTTFKRRKCSYSPYCTTA